MYFESSMAMTYQVFLYDSFPLILQTFILYSVKDDSLVFDGSIFYQKLADPYDSQNHSKYGSKCTVYILIF